MFLRKRVIDRLRKRQRVSIKHHIKGEYRVMTERKLTTAINEIGVAVDVGSTSIGVCCVDLIHKTEILSFSFANPQYIYGADVVTRIKHCLDNRDDAKKMKALVEDALQEKLSEKLGIDYQHIRRIVYSGNTVMLHILRGLSVEGLAYAPFKPMDIEYYESKGFLCEQNDVTKPKDCEVVYSYLPGFSAFVGADILSGAWFLQMGQHTSYDLLIDLGTNGEMLLLNKEKGFATSTACGPVFDHVINGAKYGSESIKVIANCVKRGLIDETGKLVDTLFEKGILIDKNFTIKQENIRNLQLAKGAIYAGIQCLLEKAGITAEDVTKVYVCGGLGFYLDKRDAFALKMLPKEFADKIIVSGNTSLEGAKRFLLSDRAKRVEILKMWDNICKCTKSFELATCERFQEIYLNSLDFI